MFGWFKKKIKILFEKSDETLYENYIEAGMIYGDTLSYSFFGECNPTLEKLRKNFKEAEKAYYDRGYKLYTLDDFVEYGGYGKGLPFGMVKL